VVAAAGGVGGVVLLLCTPRDLFAEVVPFLLVFASLGLLAQPRIAAWRDRRLQHPRRLLLPLGLFTVSVYNGYFGAGSGVMVLALLLLTVDRDLAQANALKNVMLGIVDVVAATGFAFFGPVRWTSALPLAVGLFAGSRFGPSVTRRVPGNVIRVLAALAGLGLAIRLWVVPT
jgi:hypothetical protein